MNLATVVNHNSRPTFANADPHLEAVSGTSAGPALLEASRGVARNLAGTCLSELGVHRCNWHCLTPCKRPPNVRPKLSPVRPDPAEFRATPSRIRARFFRPPRVPDPPHRPSLKHPESCHPDIPKSDLQAENGSSRVTQVTARERRRELPQHVVRGLGHPLDGLRVVQEPVASRRARARRVAARETRRPPERPTERSRSVVVLLGKLQKTRHTHVARFQSKHPLDVPRACLGDLRTPSVDNNSLGPSNAKRSKNGRRTKSPKRNMIRTHIS